MGFDWLCDGLVAEPLSGEHHRALSSAPFGGACVNARLAIWEIASQSGGLVAFRGSGVTSGCFGRAWPLAWEVQRVGPLVSSPSNHSGSRVDRPN
jgi:hypothetical protein